LLIFVAGIELGEEGELAKYMLCELVPLFSLKEIDELIDTEEIDIFLVLDDLEEDELYDETIDSFYFHSIIVSRSKCSSRFKI
jgi:hypothetical protein